MTEEVLDLEEETMEELPRDVLTEILSYLPAKDICKCRCLSKSFMAASYDTLLTPLHVSRRAGTVDGMICLTYIGEVNFYFYQPSDDDDGRIIPSVGMPKEAMRYVRHRATEKVDGRRTAIVGSAGGFLLFEFGSRRMLSLYDPVGRVEQILPNPAGDLKMRTWNCGTGVFMHSGRLFLLTNEVGWERQPHLRCWSYSFADGTWSGEVKIPKPSRELNLQRHTMIGTKVYVVTDCFPAYSTSPYVLEIDIPTMASRVVPLPEGARALSLHDELEIGLWGGRLHLARWQPREERFVVWEMENVGACKWSEVMYSVDLQTMIAACGTCEDAAAEVSVSARGCDSSSIRLQAVERGLRPRRSRWWNLKDDLKRECGVWFFGLVDSGKLAFAAGRRLYMWDVYGNKMMDAYKKRMIRGLLSAHPYSNILHHSTFHI